MSKKMYTAEEALEILCQTDESSAESSLSDSDSEFVPVESSDTETSTESDDEPIATKRARRTISPNISTAVDADELPCTSTAVHPEEVPCTSSAVQHELTHTTSQLPQQRPRKIRATQPQRMHSIVPEALSNPLWLPPDSGMPVIPPFIAPAGIQVRTENFTAIDFFNLYFPQDFFQFIVDQTNLYAQQFIESHPNSSYSRPFNWKPVTLKEIKIFLGLTLNMGINTKNELVSHWSTNPLYYTPLYSAAMPRTRYQNILRFLHFNDNTLCPPRADPAYDRLYKIRPLINHFNQKFSDIYTPQKNICVDESLIHFTGRLKFKQYLPSKRARYGVKLYKLCERATGYTHSFRVYEGKDTQLQPPGCPSYIGSSGKTVWDLMLPLFDQGYHLYVDNFYTSVPLFKHLYLKKTVACGTMRPNRKGFPQRLVNKKLKKGEFESLRNEELLALKWKDKRDVYMMSTIHQNSSCQIQRHSGLVEKPLCVHEYNLYMGGVDLNDQMLQPYLAIRRSIHWYKKVAIYLFQLAIYNSHVVYKSADGPDTFLRYQEQINTALIFQENPVCNMVQSDAVSRLYERHFPEAIPSTQAQKYPQKKCRVCSRGGVRRDSRYFCPSCPSQPGLCIKDCFRLYHTSLQY